jgi:hypothetical protein
MLDVDTLMALSPATTGLLQRLLRFLREPIDVRRYLFRACSPHARALK